MHRSSPLGVSVKAHLKLILEILFSRELMPYLKHLKIQSRRSEKQLRGPSAGLRSSMVMCSRIFHSSQWSSKSYAKNSKMYLRLRTRLVMRLKILQLPLEETTNHQIHFPHISRNYLKNLQMQLTAATHIHKQPKFRYLLSLPSRHWLRGVQVALQLKFMRCSCPCSPSGSIHLIQVRCLRASKKNIKTALEE